MGMGMDDRRLLRILREVAIWGFSVSIGWYAVNQLFQRLDPDAGSKAEAKQKALAASNRLNSIFAPDADSDEEDDSSSDDEAPRNRPSRRVRKDHLVLSTYEQNIAMEVVSPADIPVTFADIGGLDSQIEELRESIIYPLTFPHLYTAHSSLLTAPSGVLLYGPPGCGKTMLARALAKESGAAFINLHISTLTEKWYGDSNKLVAAVFSLARKLSPTIVFIDEIDAVLGQRRSGEHEASGMVKAEFMTHWDGLASSTVEAGAQRIVVLGATNRIQDIDEAILRRMPKKFSVGLPNARQRRQIFELTLRDTKVEEEGFEIDVLVRVSAGMSGSDIKEACRDAAMVPVREHIRSLRSSGADMNPRSRRKREKEQPVRGLKTDDFFGRSAAASMLASTDKYDVPRRKRAVERAQDEVHSDGESGGTEEVDEFDDLRDGSEIRSSA